MFIWTTFENKFHFFKKIYHSTSYYIVWVQLKCILSVYMYPVLWSLVNTPIFGIEEPDSTSVYNFYNSQVTPSISEHFHLILSLLVTMRCNNFCIPVCLLLGAMWLFQMLMRNPLGTHYLLPTLTGVLHICKSQPNIEVKGRVWCSSAAICCQCALSTLVALFWSTLEFGIVCNLNTCGTYFPRDNKILILLFAIALAETSKNCFMNHVCVIKNFLYNLNVTVLF